MKPNKIMIFRKFILLYFLIFNSCAYFNTFFNAQEYFNEAEKLRLEKDGEKIPIGAIEKYGKSIKKSKKVIIDFPDSKFKNSAILLMAKSQFYREDYDLSIENLKIISSFGTNEQIEEAKYWTSLCKWKKGNMQAAIDELTLLTNSAEINDIKSKAYLSLADIYKELKKPEESIDYLQSAIKTTKNRNQKGIISNKLAEMAYEKNDLGLALQGYEMVTAFSLSKKNIENAHLQMLRIYRVQNKYKKATRKIKSMLTDDKFNSIAGNLELELVQLYRAQGETSEVETRLGSIVNDYQRTLVSAEAYFQLGQIYSKEKWNLSKAKEYFTQVNKESSKSIYSSVARGKIDAISLYEKTEMEIESKLKSMEKIEEDSTVVSSDSVNTELKKVSLVPVSKSLPELYYQLADLEAFKFERFNESIILLNKIINDFSNSDFKPKSLFALSFVYKMNKQFDEAEKVESLLKKDFSETEYAFYLTDEKTGYENEEAKLYNNGRNLLFKNSIEGLSLLKELIKNSEKSDIIISSAFSIAYYYDKVAEIDSSHKYYSFISESYPDTDHSIRAKDRLFILNGILSLTNQDSSKIDSKQ